MSYLVSRKSTNPYKISAVIFFGSVFAYGNYAFVDWLTSSPTALCNSGLGALVSIFSALVYLGVLVAVLGTLFVLPSAKLLAISSSIEKMSRNRVLDDLTSTGLSARSIFNQLIAVNLKDAVIGTTPALLFWAAVGYEPHMNAIGVITAIFVWTLIVSFTCLKIWSVCAGDRGGLFVIAPVVFLYGVPALLFALSVPPLFAFGTSVIYVVTLSYFLSLRALESRGEFRDVASKLRVVFTLKRKRPILAENAIVARQEAIGLEFGDILNVAFISLGMLGAMYLGVKPETNSAWPVLMVLLMAGFFAAFRAATKLSQSLTQEMEGSTLEILRSTPLGSQRFLDGWLQLTLRPLYRELGLFCMVAFAYTLTAFPTSLVDGSFAYIAVIVLASPFVGALFGASIAGQLKTRDKVAGQLSYTVGLGAFLAFPQVITVASGAIVWPQVALTLVVVYIAAWLLRTGAEKSLNRVFLPQK